MRAKPTQDSEKGHRYPPPLILPVKKEDARPLAVLGFEAISPGALYSYLYPSPSDRVNVIKDRENRFKTIPSYPNLMWMKAIDPDTGEVAAYAIWQRTVSSQWKEKQGLQPQKWEEGTNFHLMSPPSGNNLEEKKSIWAYMSAEKSKLMESWAKDMDYLELVELATAPRFQRRGYATALLKWGHEKADKEKQVCFLLASPFGRYLYAGLGWKELGQVAVDINRWAEGGGREDLGWGVWKFYFMIRLPRRLHELD